MLNGEAYLVGTKIKGKTQLWEAIERDTHVAKELLTEKVTASLSASKTDKTAQTLNQWSARQAEMLVERLRELK